MIFIGLMALALAGSIIYYLQTQRPFQVSLKHEAQQQQVNLNPQQKSSKIGKFLSAQQQQTLRRQMQEDPRSARRLQFFVRAFKAVVCLSLAAIVIIAVCSDQERYRFVREMAKKWTVWVFPKTEPLFNDL